MNDIPTKQPFNLNFIWFQQDTKADKKKLGNKKPVGGRNLEALNALAAATEQTLKVFNQLLPSQSGSILTNCLH